MKRRTWLSLTAMALIACSAAVFAAEPEAAKPKQPIKGNPKTKVYHKPACRYYKAKGCTKEFKTEADAKKAGYKPCKKCAGPKKDKKEKPAEEEAKPAETTPATE